MTKVMVYNFQTEQYEQANEAEGQEFVGLIESMNAACAAQQSVRRTRAYCECKKPAEFLYGDTYYCKVCNRPCR